jgi:ketosteroid isomerase-like protein
MNQTETSSPEVPLIGTRCSPTSRLSLRGITDAGPGHVIAISHLAGTARASGVPTEIRVPVVYTIRDGKIVRAREYLTMDEALRAADVTD